MMSAIPVVGAGGQGGPRASILARDDQFYEVRLGGHTEAGVISSECLEPGRFLEISADMEAPVGFDERTADDAVAEGQGG